MHVINSVALFITLFITLFIVMDVVLLLLSTLWSLFSISVLRVLISSKHETFNTFCEWMLGPRGLTL